uniref:Uncharacterized protein n=1 Tax=Setaria viridis TaxID=4556 RepID=A0A4U6VB17_SETVI|nr:hypothetical protein SEVIR_3G115300v2 [Setaria viridis]
MQFSAFLFMSGVTVGPYALVEAAVRGRPEEAGHRPGAMPSPSRLTASCSRYPASRSRASDSSSRRWAPRPRHLPRVLRDGAPARRPPVGCPPPAPASPTRACRTSWPRASGRGRSCSGT